VDGLKEGVHELAVKFILPQDLALKNDPPAVSVQVKKLR
jgi:hypothetical protein